MLTEDHFEKVLAAYALGSLDEEEASQVAEHLAICRVCRAELASYQAIADQLALAAPDAAPPAALKQQILGRIQSPHAGPATGHRRSSWWPLAGQSQRATWAWSMLALVLLAMLVASNLWWWQGNRSERPVITSGGMQVVAMSGSEAAPEATGTLIISDDGEHGALVVDGLSPLDIDRQYQLWLIRDGQRTSGGVFSVDAEGYGVVWLSSPEPLSSFPAFGVTIEPAGGSPGPTGDKVLGGEL